MARDSRTACIWQSFASESFILFYTLEMIVWTDGFPADHQSMITQFADAFLKMGLIGQANNFLKVSNQHMYRQSLS